MMLREAWTIPINQSTRRVIIAHRLLESDLMEGGVLGKPVADYVFRLAEGTEIRIPIRERFEIADLARWRGAVPCTPGSERSTDVPL